MKVSKYNEFIKHDDRTLAFNAMTCALAEVDSDFFEILNRVKNNDNIDLSSDLVKNMQYGGYIVNDQYNEIEALKFRSYASKFNTSGLGLTIAPTLACNFACPYCYEVPQAGIMPEEVQDSIIKFIQQKSKTITRLSVSWYGGEPLLGFDVIKSLSNRILKICDDNGISYDAFMISNCYLITDEIAEGLAKLKISGVQVTIDGPSYIHNARRKLKHGHDDTYSKIINNVKKLLSVGITPHIRVNVDKTNSDCVEELLDDLKSNGLQKCVVNFGHVNAYTEACSNIESNCLSVEEYAFETLHYQDLLVERGFSADNYPNYPGIKGNYCCADAINSFVIDPNGYLYKCWNDIGNLERAVGNLCQPESISSKEEAILQSYMLWSPFEHQKCLECSILPICMGGCPYNGMINNGVPECEKWKFNIKEALLKVKEGK